ncbi:hypothetical protein G6Z34_13655 [Clostridium perfringens]|uniref:Lipoprotein n=1 Tax=Clostridium perfringens TaxID=1502 RepID=A0AAP7BWS7_CLOPF|nr:hypothetical protein [Clostridium perfringens]NGU31132.1 hypothetical protein [Clostridium perfringens]
MIKIILIIGTLIIGILSTIVGCKMDYKTIGEKIFIFISSCCIGFVVVGGIILITIVLTRNFAIDEELKEVNVKQLVSMKFDKNIEGNFYLGTGSINNEEYVIFYTKENNELVRQKYKSDNVKIFTDTDKPKVQIKTKDKITKLYTIFGELNENHEDVYEIEFHIPEKSIIENINLN